MPEDGATGAGGSTDGGTGSDTSTTNTVNTGNTSGNTNSGSSQSGNAGGDTGQQTTFSAEYVKQVRDEAAKERIARTKLEQRLKQIEDAQLSEQEKLTKRASELEAQNSSLLQTMRRQAVEGAARDAGATVPQSIVGMIPAEAEDVNAAVLALKKQYPQLFAKAVQGSADGGGGTNVGEGGVQPKADMNKIIRTMAGRG
jgi:hypothetical protein